LAVQLGQYDDHDGGLFQWAQRVFAEFIEDRPDVAFGEQVAVQGFQQGG